MFKHDSIAACAALALVLAGSAAAAQPAPIASTDGEKSGVRIDVTELKRSSGDTLILKFTIVNDSDDGQRSEFGDTNSGKDGRSMGGVHLIDAANKKKYLVVRDANGYCVCSQDVATIEAGERTNVWARFPAPPQDVQTIGIVIPHFIPLDDVPIEQ